MRASTMCPHVVAASDIVEEVNLGRTLLSQGHLETAQRVLVSVCQANEDCAEAFHLLADVLTRKGDEARARILLEYAEELDVALGQLPCLPLGPQSEVDTKLLASGALNGETTPLLHSAVLAPRRSALSPPPDLPAQGESRRGASGEVRGTEIQPPASSTPQPSSTASLSEAVTPKPAPLVTPLASTSPVITPRPSNSLNEVPGSRDSFSTQPASRDSLFHAVYPARSPSSPELSKRPNRRRDNIILVLAAVAVAAVGGVAAFGNYGKGRNATMSSAIETLDAALASGVLDSLMRARELARVEQNVGAPDLDVWARVGLVNAVLVRDFAVDARKGAEDALDRAGSALQPTKDREALIAIARSFLALSIGDRIKAKERVDQALSLTTSDASAVSAALALLASSRVLTYAGDSDGAMAALDKALSLAPTHGLIVVDWAASRLEGGDPVSARRALSEYLQTHQGNSRARLLLMQAERALGDPSYVKELELACGDDVQISRTIRTSCALAAAEKARLEGTRHDAIKRAKAAVDRVDDPVALGQAALLLALLGEVDEAENFLVKARKSPEATEMALRWPDVAIRLARGEQISSEPSLAKPIGPERVMVALRAAYARLGAQALAATLKAVPPGILDIDSELRAFAVLGKEDAVAKNERAGLESRVAKGNPVAAYVLGILYARENDAKGAARRLEKAMVNHGDACQAAKLYIEVLTAAKQAGSINKSLVKNLLSHNAKCPVSSAL